ncbi:Vasculin-like 1, partial [Nestor notabilis]
MAQHDFVPAWLNFSTPQSTKSPAATFEKHGEHLPRGEGRFGVSRRRHNSSDGFFNNGPLRAAGGAHVGLSGSQPGWHGPSRGHDGVNQRGGGGTGVHRHWNGNFHSRKSSAFQEKLPVESREEKKEDKEQLQFEEEDFPSLNPEAGRQNNQNKPLGTPSGVWENPPSAKQPTKMLVIKKVSKEDPAAAFSAAFTSPVSHLANGNKATTIVPSVYKNLVPKPAAPPSKPSPWKANRSEHKPGSLSSSRDSAFTSPVSVTKPAVLASGSVLTSPKEVRGWSPSSTTPPIEICSSRLTKLMRRTTDKKSEFLKALKDDRNGEITENRESVYVIQTLEEKRNDFQWSGIHASSSRKVPGGEGSLDFCKDFLRSRTIPCFNILICFQEEGENLSHSLEAEHRLLKEMGWQEYPENDENYLPLTEDELKEFQIKSEQRRRNGFGKNGFLQGRGSSLLFHWRSTFKTKIEDSDTETSSSETSDDD